jgi:hypothetical protein
MSIKIQLIEMKVKNKITVAVIISIILIVFAAVGEPLIPNTPRPGL